MGGIFGGNSKEEQMQKAALKNAAKSAAKSASASIADKYTNTSGSYVGDAYTAYQKRYEGINDPTKLGQSLPAPNITGVTQSVKSPSADIASTLNQNINTSTNTSTFPLNGTSTNDGLGKTLFDAQDSSSKTVDNALKSNDVTGQNMSQVFSNSGEQVFSV